MDDFAQKLAQSKSMQGLVRALGLFAKRHPDGGSVKVQWMDGGASVDFGAGASAAERGPMDFIEALEKTEELMFLEQVIDRLKGWGGQAELIDSLVEQAEKLAREIYKSEWNDAAGEK